MRYWRVLKGGGRVVSCRLGEKYAFGGEERRGWGGFIIEKDHTSPAKRIPHRLKRA